MIVGEQIKYRNAYEEMRLANPSETNTKLEVFEYVDQTIERIKQLAAVYAFTIKNSFPLFLIIVPVFQLFRFVCSTLFYLICN